MEATTATVICKNCGYSFHGKYCNKCGEKVYTEHDRTLAHFFEEGIHFFTHFEGTFFTTLKYIFTRPGKLSEEYCRGIRKSLFKPLSLFFLLVLLYLLFPIFEGLNQNLKFYFNNDLYGDYASRKAAELMQAHNWSKEELATAFHQKSEKVSKFLLIVLLPVTALFFWLFTFKKRKYFFDQMVFATEINCVYLIWGFLVMPLLLTLFITLCNILSIKVPPLTDSILSLIVYAVLLFYLVIAAHRFYRMKWLYAIGLAVVFYFAHDIIVGLIYKFLLFTITASLLH